MLYYRVSTGRQDYGIEAQKMQVTRFLRDYPYHIVGEFVEHESGAKDLKHRPELRKAIQLCHAHHATLLVSRLDRLSRSVRFVANLMEQVKFLCVDYPFATPEMIYIHAVFAQWEREMISRRTKEALAAAKERGVKLGRNNLPKEKPPRDPAKLSPSEEHAIKVMTEVHRLRLQGVLTIRDTVNALNEMGIGSYSGKRWHSQTLVRLYKTYNALHDRLMEVEKAKRRAVRKAKAPIGDTDRQSQANDDAEPCVSAPPAPQMESTPSP